VVGSVSPTLAGVDKVSRRISTSIRLSVEEYLRVKKQASKAHLTVADYMRKCLVGPKLSNWPIREKA
jgi:hypothetical protein